MQQKKVLDEVYRDLSGGHIMNRLIQGDVGSGKTIIAVLALLQAAGNGYQGALMVPTEVLARQHFESMNELFTGLGLVCQTCPSDRFHGSQRKEAGLRNDCKP